MFENLKEKFLTLSINKQIKFGILCVNFFVFFLVLALVTINAYIILSLNYYNFVDIIDTKQDQQLDSASVFIDIEVFSLIESTKDTVLWTRRTMENYLQNLDYIKNLKSSVNIYSKLAEFDTLQSRPDCIEYLPLCIAYHQYDSTGINADEQEEYYKMIYMMVPFLQEIFKYRTFRASDTEMFFKFSILSKKYNTIFFYPSNNIYVKLTEETYKNYTYTNPSFNEAYFKSMMLTYKEKIAERFSLADSIGYQNLDYNDIYNILLRNPNTHFSSLRTELKPYVFPSDLYGGALVSTMNLKYNPNLKDLLNITNIYNQDNPDSLESIEENNLSFIDDVIVGDWSGITLDAFTLDLSRQIKGLNLIASSADRDALETTFSSENCLLQISKFSALNNFITTDNNIMYQIATGNTANFPTTSISCTKFPAGHQNFNETYYKVPYDADSRIVRIKNSIKLINNYANNSGYNITYSGGVVQNYPDSINELGSNIDDGMYYKIFKIYLPNVFTQTLIDSIFLSNYEIFVYVIKNTRYLENDIYPIKMRIVGGFLLIFIFTVIIWVVELILIAIILDKVTISLTAPINALTVYVKSIGQDQFKNKNSYKLSKKSLKDLENLSYPDDEDIDELFDICKSMIKGGFSDDNILMKKETLNIVESTAYHIKANNIIVDEDYIELSGLTSGTHIFSYRGNQALEKMKMLKYDDSHKQFTKRITKVQEKVRRITSSMYKKTISINIKNTNNKLDDNENANLISNWKSKQKISEAAKKSCINILSELEKKHFRFNEIRDKEKNKINRKETNVKEKKKDIEENKEKPSLTLLQIHDKIKAKYNNKEFKIIKF